MSGIYFLGTNKLDELKDFYTDEIGCELWLEQADCAICQHGNMLFGFCQREQAETGGILCFFYEKRESVDRMHSKLKAVALNRPHVGEKYQIYHFFAADPEGRQIEFQCFEHPVAKHLSGAELLLRRRSVRKFKAGDVPEELLQQVLENCRFAPTSRNSQSYYFKIIRERNLLEKIAATREWKSGPIANGPSAVAICADPSLSQRYLQDGCIAAYHFLLAAWQHGLGTCWIAAMDRDDVKEWLNIPKEHYIATITPLGFPEDSLIEAPKRKELSWFLRD